MKPDKGNEPTAYENTPAGMQARWEREFESAERENKDFKLKSKVVLQHYLDRRDGLFDEHRKNVNLFWSTTQVLLSSLFARAPKVDVSRLHKDENDDVARVAGLILERILNAGIQDESRYDREAFKEAIRDRLIVGLGVVWARYEVETRQQTVPAMVDPITGQTVGEDVTAEVIVREDVPIDYVHWEDFDWSPARRWEEVRWVSRKVYLTREQATKRFGEVIASQLQYVNTKKSESPIDVQASAWSKACVYEVWCKDEKKVYWFSKGCPTILDVRDDPLQLEGFFPCPRPLVANVTSSRFMPKSDYAMAQDIYQQMDELNTRIAWLTKACKVAGLYDQNTKGSVQRLFQEGSELTLIPVDNWAMFAEKGGVQGTIVFLPIEQIASVIAQLRTELAQAQQQLYEVIGISDIMRGASDPDETLGAQQLKAQFGSSRIQFTMSEIADWVAAACRIKAQIIVRHCQDETILKWSNITATPDAQFAQQALALLREPDQFRWRVTIDPDTMAAIDYAREREARTQMLDALGVFLERMTPLIQSMPQAGPFALHLVKWAMAGFKVGKEIESTIDKLLDAANQPPQDPGPSEDYQIKMAEIQSRERIAMLNDETKREVEGMKAGIDVWKTGLETQLHGIQASIQGLNEQLASSAQAREVESAAARQQNDAMMQKIADALGKISNPPRRRRRPIRDENGDIVEVVEEDIQEEAPAAAPLPIAPIPPLGGPVQ